MSAEVQSSGVDHILRQIMEGTASETGEAFFQALVRSLAGALGGRYAFVSEFVPGATARVRTLAFWGGDDFLENVEYDLQDTPCEQVLQGEVCLYPKNIQTLFPKERALVDMGAQSYLAVPLANRTGDVLGHLAAIDVAPMEGSPQDFALFHIFGARASLRRTRSSARRRSSSAAALAISSTRPARP
nr:GAF domain-containing protein [Gammaproteobacteria bacterium]